MESLFSGFISMLAGIFSFIGFLVAGFALGRFTLDAFGKTLWQVQIALVIGFFGLLAALTRYASTDLAGVFALGAGIAFLMEYAPKREEVKGSEHQDTRDS